MNEIIMILKNKPEDICRFLSIHAKCRWNVRFNFLKFPFLLIMILWRETWNLMETSRPDVDFDLKFLYISEMFSLWIRKQIAEHTTATAACYANIQGINEMRRLEKRGNWEIFEKGKRFSYFSVLFNLPSGKMSEFRSR